MKGRKKSKFADVTMKVAPIFFAVAIALCALFLIIGEIIAPSESRMDDSDWKLFEADWYQVTDTGERVPVTVPGTIDAQWGEVVTLVTKLPDDVVKGDNLCFHLIWQDAKLYVDGELRESYDTTETRPFG